MTRVLVTGASGFLGRRVLAPLASAGYDVHAVSRAGGTGDGATWHRADLLSDPQTVIEAVRPDVLLHLAWTTEHGRFWTAPDNVRWVEASLALLRAFVGVGGRRAVLAGTCAEYDWTTGATMLSEDAAVAPATLYGASKAGLHRVAAAYAEQEGVAFAWGRVFFPYGPDEASERLVASVARALIAGDHAETTAGTQVRDFIHADDVAKAFAALVSSDATGPVNIGTGQGVTIREIVEALAAAAGRPELLRVGSIPMRPDDPPVVVANARRLTHEVGYTPVISLAEGLAGVVDSLRRE